ncbi:unnamed protein product [Rotaria sordida]|uniref:RING-type domain-containing protein n=1 Tax=Rotaria sordida TaxID=392033 RepID=A0A814CH27_9BILA|nr:unnamed protein product [Rotaria sordida]CAF1012618.1 unnamed protein product [Rotaria sordida]CAF1216785.1 unnamed protein product [Rotaria sordida]CAF3806649.1 unnamed protein product [Rotaria sordida]
MSQERRLHNNSNDDDAMNNRHQMEYEIASDNLEFIPTFLKIKQIILLRHSDFINLLNEFNDTLEKFTRDEPYYLRFTIVPHSDSNVFWKALIRIKCSKISRADQSRLNEIVLSLQQFLSVHQSLCQQIAILQKCSSPTLYNSSPTDQNSSSFSTAKLSFSISNNDNECCICMDRKPNLVLPCTHKFCDECFHEWSSQTSPTSSQTCPLCRVDVNSDSGFVLAETPKYDNVKKMLTESILSLPIDLKNRANDGTSMIRSYRE